MPVEKPTAEQSRALSLLSAEMQGNVFVQDWPFRESVNRFYFCSILQLARLKNFLLVAEPKIEHKI